MGQQGSSKSNYHFLVLKQQLASIRQHQNQLQQLVRENVPEEIALAMHKYPLDSQKAILTELFDIVMGTSWARSAVSRSREDLLDKAKQLHEFQTQRNYFLVENFRDCCSEPITSALPAHCYNLNRLFKVSINKQLRRVLWSKCLCVEETKMEFFSFDHKIVPYNLTEELTIGLVRLSLENQIKLKENQKDCCLRLLEYIVKKWNKIPTKGQQSLAIACVDVYAHFTPSKMHEIGASFVGLHELTEVYFEADVQERLGLIKLAFKLVDAETFGLIQQCYLPYSESDNAELNECFQLFRLSLTTVFLPLGAAQYLIDQLLIKKRNRFDMYIIFAIMTMILSDELEKYRDSRMKLTDVVNPANCKRVIKLNDVVDAFTVIYENVHPYHLTDGGSGRNNLLLNELIGFDQLAERQHSGGHFVPSSLKDVGPGQEAMAGFVVEDKSAVLRLGAKKK